MYSRSDVNLSGEHRCKTKRRMKSTKPESYRYKIFACMEDLQLNWR